VSWFTIIAENPEGDLRPRLEGKRTFFKNSANQWVLWDGPANRRDIIAMATALFPYFGCLDAFEGKEPGRCIFTKGKLLPIQESSLWKELERQANEKL